MFYKLISTLSAGAAISGNLISKTAPAVTAPPGTSSIDNRISSLQQRQQTIENRLSANQAKEAAYSSKLPEYNAFRQSLLQDRISVLDNTDKNLSLVNENNTLRLAIANDLKQIKQSGAALPADTVTTLKNDNSQIKVITNDIKSTKGQIKTIVQNNKTNIQNKDYTAMDAAFSQVDTIQDWRNQQLADINNILTQMKSLLDSAVSGTSASNV